MNYKTIVTTLLVMLLLTGCATPYTGQKVADAGTAPTEDQSKKAVLDYLTSTLKDPDSLKQFRIVGQPMYMTWFRGLINGGGNESAWLVCFEYNAKNSYGGYVGVKTEGLAIRVYGDWPSVITGVNWAIADRGC